jgi:hypothetical protein
VRIKAVPTIAAIQRSTAVVAVPIGAVMWVAGSSANALAFLLGTALMMVNLYALSVTVKGLFAIARHAGGTKQLGLVALPFKMLLLGAIAYELIESCQVNLPWFVIGTLTQFAGIFIEVTRASAPWKEEEAS